MAVDKKLLIKVFSPRIVAKALVTLDKSMMVVVGFSWLAALVMMLVAIHAVNSAVDAKRDVAAAIVAEPVLPQTTMTGISSHEIQVVLERLQHQFPDVKIETGPNDTIAIKSVDGSKFHQWVMALGYIDIMTPQLRWTLTDFCVGTCSNSDLMRATVSGQKMVFSLPQT